MSWLYCDRTVLPQIIPFHLHADNRLNYSIPFQFLGLDFISIEGEVLKESKIMSTATIQEQQPLFEK